MKKITAMVLALMFSLLASAQMQPSNPMQQPLPIDPNVKYGKLENGMTYYIRHNKYPENRADFYIAQRVGSMQEEDSQSGLAHFLEHMAFNGTKHFPGRKTMTDYLEKVGAKFGPDINAYTGFDETVYTLTDIPVVRQGIIDSTLLILHDWSSYIDLKDEEIDKERPIIKEEWRTRAGASQRIWEKQLPIIFKGSKYADRLPIGKMSIVENFKYQELKDYYKKWYRPDLQAIIVVGDIDAEKMETQVKKLFSRIPMPENASERIYHPVPDNDAPIVSIVTDKEENISTIFYYIKHDVLPPAVKQTEMGYTVEIAINLAATMLSERLAEISKIAESPFTSSYTFNGEFFVSKSKNAWTSIVMSKEGKEKESLAALIRETERVKQFGFTDTELERAKADLLIGVEQSYNNRDKQQNNSYVQEYVRSFSDGEPIPGIEYEYEMMQRLLPTISSDVINGMVLQLLTDQNNIITITGPEKTELKLPTEEEVIATIEAVRAEEIDGYMEELITEPLVSTRPEAGTIEKEEYNEELETTIWTLSNGMKVAFKATDYKNDEIVMSSLAYGGTSWAADEDVYAANFVNYVPYFGGLGNFNSTDLKKVLSGKNAGVNISLQEWTQGINGRSSVRDLETMLQLTYLTFTAPRKDDAMFSNFKNSAISQLQNLESDPSNIFQQHIAFANYGNNPRYKSMKAIDIEKLDYDKLIELYKQAFSNPGSFTFSFVGNVDKETLKPLVETYLASLPAGNVKAKYKNVDSKVRQGNYKSMFDEKMINPKTKVYTLYSGKLDFNRKNVLYLTTLEHILNMVYTETIREAEGGTYGVSVYSDLARVPEGNASLYMNFDTNPEKVERLVPIIHSELKKIAEDGINETIFDKVKENTLKQYDQDMKQNGSWANIITNTIFYKDNSFTTIYGEMKKMTREDVQNVAKELISQKNNIEVVMNPREK